MTSRFIFSHIPPHTPISTLLRLLYFCIKMFYTPWVILLNEHLFWPASLNTSAPGSSRPGAPSLLINMKHPSVHVNSHVTCWLCLGAFDVCGVCVLCVTRTVACQVLISRAWGRAGQKFLFQEKQGQKEKPKRQGKQLAHKNKWARVADGFFLLQVQMEQNLSGLSLVSWCFVWPNGAFTFF